MGKTLQSVEQLVSPEIASNLPGPLYRILTQLVREEVQFRRVHRLIDSFEWIIIYNTVIALSCLRQEAEFPEEVRRKLAYGLNKISLGSWYSLYRCACNLLKGRNTPLPKPKGFDRVVQNSNIIQFRNSYAHGATPSEEECRSDFEEHLPVLKKLLTLSIFQSRDLCFTVNGQSYLWKGDSLLPLDIAAAKEDTVTVLSRDGRAVHLLPLSTVNRLGEDWLFYHYNSHKENKHVEQLNYARAKRFRNENLWEKFHSSFPLNQWKTELNSAEYGFLDRIDSLSGVFFGRSKLLDDLQSFCENGSGTFILTGAPGMGKSSVLAKLISNLLLMEKELPFHTFHYFISKGSFSKPKVFLDTLSRYISKAYSVQYHKSLYGEDESHLQLLGLIDEISRIPGKPSLLLVIDALDEGQDLLQYIPESSSWLRVLVTGRKTQDFSRWAQERKSSGAVVRHLERLADEDIRGILYQCYDKYQDTFTQEYVGRLSSLSEGNPLFLKLLSGSIINLTGELPDLDLIPSAIDDFLDDILLKVTEEGRDSTSLKALRFYAAALSPVPLTVLAEFLEIDSIRCRGVFRKIQELLEVRECPLWNESCYTFFHETLAEHLRKTTETERVSAEIAEKCLTWRKASCTEMKVYVSEYGVQHLLEAYRATGDKHFLNGALSLVQDWDYFDFQKKHLESYGNSLEDLIAVQREICQRPSGGVGEIVTAVELIKRYNKTADQSRVDCIGELVLTADGTRNTWETMLRTLDEIHHFSSDSQARLIVSMLSLAACELCGTQDSDMEHDQRELAIRRLSQEVKSFERTRYLDCFASTRHLAIVLMLLRPSGNPELCQDALLLISDRSKFLTALLEILELVRKEDDNVGKMAHVLLSEVSEVLDISETSIPLLSSAATYLHHEGSEERAVEIWHKLIEHIGSSGDFKPGERAQTLSVARDYLSCVEEADTELLLQCAGAVRELGWEHHRMLFEIFAESSSIPDRKDFFKKIALLNPKLRRRRFEQSPFAPPAIGTRIFSSQDLPAYSNGYREMVFRFFVKDAIDRDLPNLLDEVPLPTVDEYSCRHELAIGYLRFGVYSSGIPILEGLAAQEVTNPSNAFLESERLFQDGFPWLANELAERIFDSLSECRYGAKLLGAILALYHCRNLRGVPTYREKCRSILQNIMGHDDRILGISYTARIFIEYGDEAPALELLEDSVFSSSCILSIGFNTQFGDPMKELARTISSFKAPENRKNALNILLSQFSRKTYPLYAQVARQDLLNHSRIENRELPAGNPKDANALKEKPLESIDIRKELFLKTSYYLQMTKDQSFLDFPRQYLNKALRNILDLAVGSGAPDDFLPLIHELLLTSVDLITTENTKECIHFLTLVSMSMEPKVADLVEGFIAEAELEDVPERRVSLLSDIALWFGYSGMNEKMDDLLTEAENAVYEIRSFGDQIEALLKILRARAFLKDSKAEMTYIKLEELLLSGQRDLSVQEILPLFQHMLYYEESIIGHISKNETLIKALSISDDESREKITWLLMNALNSQDALTEEMLLCASRALESYEDIYIKTDATWNLIGLCEGNLPEDSKLQILRTAYEIAASIDEENDPEGCRDSIFEGIIHYAFCLENEENREHFIESVLEQGNGREHIQAVTAAKIREDLIHNRLDEVHNAIAGFFLENPGDYFQLLSNSEFSFLESVLRYCTSLHEQGREGEARCLLFAHLNGFLAEERFPPVTDILRWISLNESKSGYQALVKTVLEYLSSYDGDKGFSAEMLAALMDISSTISNAIERSDYLTRILFLFIHQESTVVIDRVLAAIFIKILQTSKDTSIENIINNLRLTGERSESILLCVTEQLQLNDSFAESVLIQLISTRMSNPQLMVQAIACYGGILAAKSKELVVEILGLLE